MLKTITSLQNSQIKYCRKLLASSSFRKKENAFLVEGTRLCSELLKQNNTKILKCFLTKDIYDSLQEPLLSVYNKAQNKFLCDEKILKNISGTKTPQGIVCVCSQKRHLLEEESIEKNMKYLVLEGISDPGNLGTIIRTAEGLGISGVVISGPSVDVFNPKVIRASMGSVFRLPILEHENSIEVIEIFRKKEITVYGAVLLEKAKPLTKVKFSNSSAVFIGSEAEGLKEETYASCDELIMIDMRGEAESLNAAVAASILMWEMMVDTL